MRCRNHIGIAQAQLIEIGRDRGVFHAFGLVHDQHDLTTGFAQKIGDGLVVRRQSLTTIDNKNHHIRFCHCLTGLLGHLMQDAVFGDWFEAAGIDNKKGTQAHATFAVMTVARKPGQVRHQRIARAGQTIEERRFTNVRSANQSNDRLHWAS